MSFGALSFVFDGIPSERMGLYLLNTESKETTITGGAKLTLYTDKTNKSYKHSLLGVSEDEPLEFKLTFGSLNPLSRYDISAIQKWLFGHKEYKKLQIIQDDMVGVYYNCILDDPEITTIGNIPYMFECTVICDSPFAWEDEKVYEYEIGSLPKTIKLYNTSDVNDYTYPLVEFTSKASSNTVSLINLSNDSRETKIEGLALNEKVTMNNEFQILTTSTDLGRLKNFNKNWFELVRGENVIQVSGNIDTLKITYANARRIGG